MKLIKFLLLFYFCLTTFIKTDTEFLDTDKKIPFRYLDGEEEDEDDNEDDFGIYDELNDEIDNDDNADEDDFLDSRTLNINRDEDQMSNINHLQDGVGVV